MKVKLMLLKSWLYVVFLFVILIGVTPEITLWQYTWQTTAQRQRGTYNRVSINVYTIEFLFLLAFIAVLIKYVSLCIQTQEIMDSFPEAEE